MAKVTEQKNILVEAHANTLRIAPRKMRLVTNALKRMRVADALTQLQFVNKKGAPMLVKLIRSAVANAEHNFHLDPETLYIKDLTCDMGQVMKRSFPRARGSAFVIRRKTSHVHVTLISKPGKKITAKSSVFEKPAKAEEDKVKAVELEQGQVVKPEQAKSMTFKTSEQKKTSTVQQKRRLFNRKSGE